MKTGKCCALALGVAVVAAAASVVVVRKLHRAGQLDIGAPADGLSVTVLDGLWESTPSAGGPVVESFSIVQGPPSSSKKGAMPLMTFGSASGKNEFLYSGSTISGIVTGAVNEDGTQITWSHGYTSTLKSKTPIDLNGVWIAYEVNTDGKGCNKPKPIDQCSVVQRDAKVDSYCKNSLLTSSTLDAATGILTGPSEDDTGVVIGNGAVYFQAKSIMAVRMQVGVPPPSGHKKDEHEDEDEDEHEHGHHHDDFEFIAPLALLLGLVFLRVAKPEVWRRCILGTAEDTTTSAAVNPITTTNEKSDNKIKAQPLLADSPSAYPGLV